MQVIRERRRRHRRDVFTIRGDVDMSSADVLFDALLSAVLSTDSDTVFVNMADVTFFDSTGLDVLVDLREMAAACGKDVLLVEPSDRVTRVIELAGRGQGLRQVMRAGRRTTYVQL